MKAAYAKIAPAVDTVYEIVAPVAMDVLDKVIPKTHTSIPTDARVDRWVKKLSLTHDHVLVFYNTFFKYDSEGKGMITTTDFIDKIIQLKPTVIMDALYDLMDTQKAGWITFGEYVDICCTFSCFEVVDLIRYCFFVLDREKLGYVDKVTIRKHVSTAELLMCVPVMCVAE